jgi:hypothetical protein
MSQTLQRHHGRTTPYGRRRALLVAVLALFLAATAFAAPRHLLNNGEDRSSLPNDKGRSSLLDDKDRAHLSTNGWPLRGQGAYVLGNGRPAVSPHQRPVPIASVAKVMTAYVVLEHHPLRAGDSGRRFVVGQRDVVDTEARRRGGQSVVGVRAGERLTERDALMAILLPSANNIAALVARQVSGSVASFVAEMNRAARALGMPHTTYTDPSGYDDGTVSTALDQLRLARVVAKDKTLAAMMATRTYWLPIGALLGQRGDNLIKAGLYAAKQLVERLSGRAGRPSPGQPGRAPPPRAYRRHIENHIRPGNTPPP